MKRHNFESAYIKLLVYGASGVGKTRLCGTFDQDERTARALILNAAGNPITLRDNSPPPIVFDVTSFSDVSEVINFLRAPKPDHPFRKRYDIPPDVNFKTVVVDTITELQRIIVYEVAGLPYDVGSSGPIDLTQSPITRLADWNLILSRMLSLVSVLVQLPLHVVITAQERLITNETDSISSYVPMIQGAAQVHIPAYMNIVGRLVRRVRLPDGSVASSEDTGTRRTASVLFTESGGRYYAKNQYDPEIPRELVDPTATKLLRRSEK